MATYAESISQHASPPHATGRGSFADFMNEFPGFVITVIALVALVVLVGLGITGIPDADAEKAKTIATIIAGTTTAIGTISGAYIGNRFGSSGKNKAEEQRDAQASRADDQTRRTERELVRAQVLAGMLQPEDAMRAIELVDQRLRLVDESEAQRRRTQQL